MAMSRGRQYVISPGVEKIETKWMKIAARQTVKRVPQSFPRDMVEMQIALIMHHRPSMGFSDIMRADYVVEQLRHALLTGQYNGILYRSPFPDMDVAA